jgi:GNAT superfamily N-acetyltransferase
MIQTLSYEIDGPRADERSLICDSWRRSMERSPAFAKMPSRAYVAYAKDVIGNFVGHKDGSIDLVDGDHILVARDQERPKYVLGWIIYTDTAPGMALHWVYVKRDERGAGVASMLLAEAISRCDAGDMLYTVRTRFDGMWERLGFEYEPITSFETSRSVR